MEEDNSMREHWEDRREADTRGSSGKRRPGGGSSESIHFPLASQVACFLVCGRSVSLP